MIKKIFAGLFVIAVAVFLVVDIVIFYPYIHAKPMEQVLNVDYSKVDRVEIGDANNRRGVSLTDKAAVTAFLKQFDGVKLRKSFDVSQMTGFILHVTLYEGGKTVTTFALAEENLAVGANAIRYKTSVSFDFQSIRQTAEQHNFL